MPRFSLRALLVLMTLLAIWCAYSVNWIRQRRELIASGITQPYATPNGKEVTKLAPGLLFLLGETGYHWINLDMPDDGPEAERIRTLFPEATCDGYILLGVGKPPLMNEFPRGPLILEEEEERLGVAKD